MNALLAEYQAEIWAMHPLRFRPFAAALMEKSDEIAQARASGDFQSQEREAFRRNGAVGVVDIKGVLLKRDGPLLRSFGFNVTDFEEIARGIRAALADEQVEVIGLHIESPGGQAVGLKELADIIFNARSEKPVIAFLDDLAASAAFFLGSQASPGQVVSTHDALVASIGTFIAIDDWSKLFEEAGIKVHVIGSGPHKGVGTFGAEITDEQLAGLQKIVNGLAESFIEAVAQGRGMKVKAVAALATGNVFLGHDAIDMGLVDRVGTIEDALSGVSEETQEAGTMTKTATAAAAANKTKEEQEAAQAKAVEDATAQANADSRKLMADLQAAFPGEEPFALEQWKEGHSVEQAKTAHYDVVKAALVSANAATVAAKEEGDKVKAELEELKKGLKNSGTTAVAQDPPDPGASGPIEAYEAKKAELKAAGDKTPTVTMGRQHPELVSAYREAVQARADEKAKASARSA